MSEEAKGAEVNEMVIWNSVCQTDPKYTKTFSRAGGFSGTAINHTYLIREATKLWGPMGMLWRVEIVQQGIMDGAPITEIIGPDDAVEDVKVIGHEKIHFVHIRLHYPVFGTNDQGEKTQIGTGVVEHFGQTTFVGQNKKGTFTDEEAPKKSLTDAIGKALSMLGFCADVYLGLFDDNKYVNDRKAEADRADGGRVQARAMPKVDPKDLERAKNDLANCETLDDLQKTYLKLDEKMREVVKEYVRTLATGLRKAMDGKGNSEAE